MAAIVPTVVSIGRGDGSAYRVTWTPIVQNDTCVAYKSPDLSDKSIQALTTVNGTPTGAFDGCTVALHGSNDDGVTYAALNIPAGTAIGLTAAGIKAVLENTEYVKPVITGGGANQNVTVAMVIHQTNPLRT